MIIHYETIKCHNCGKIQTANVEHSIPFATWCSQCQPCGNWIGESEWTRVSISQRDYSVRALERLALQLSKSKTFIENGINISDFEIGYSAIIEDSIAVMLAKDEAQNERILSDIAQWLYEGMKQIEDEEKTVIVETPEMLIDYILNYCN